jgi:DNA-binding MarR family transcriptional regulator
MKLNDSEILVLNSILSFTEANGYPPTIRDLCKLTGYTSTSTVHTKLKVLEHKGYIELGCGAKRAIKINSYKPYSSDIVRCCECFKRYTKLCSLWMSQLDDQLIFCGAVHRDDFFCADGVRAEDCKKG